MLYDEPRKFDEELLDAIEEKAPEIVDTLRQANEKILLRHYVQVPITKIHDLAKIFTTDDNFNNLFVRLSYSTPISVTSQISSADAENNAKVFVATDFVSPLDQTRNGVHPSNISCNDDRILGLKISSGAPLCLKPNSFENLVNRNIVAGISVYE